ncbi:MAG: lytic murein transglycosylase B [Chromatiales bacterium]|jgi:membrane-bound lytic murein transglycosylase B|nr:lytic murein transglycosylase B [Chromatiales bacterium]
MMGVVTLAIATLNAAPAKSAPLPDAQLEQFATATARKHKLDVESVRAVLALARHEQRALDAYKRTAESRPWHEYRPIFLTEKRVQEGVRFWQTHEATLARAHERFGVPHSIMVAIIGVETNFGQRKGNIRVVDSLVTLAFKYKKRAKFFKRELEEFLLLAAEGSVEPGRVNGSYAGAMGIPQFIASSYRAYSIDFDGDGKRDLLNSPVDAIGSVGNYLSRHGWRRGQAIAGRARLAKNSAREIAKKGYKPHLALADMRQRGVSGLASVPSKQLAALIRLEGANGPEHWLGLRNFYVITRYNHSPLYAMAVHQLAGEIKAKFKEARQ